MSNYMCIYIFYEEKKSQYQQQSMKNNIAQHFYGRKCEEIICKTHVNIEQYLNHHEKKK